MSTKDSPTLREEERRASESLARVRAMTDSSILIGENKLKDDPTNPNEAREKFLRKLRC
jgi:hypothetical protein